MSWLKEMEVIEAVRIYLETKGFNINRVVHDTTEHGTDIVAASPSGKLIIKIEAKGQTSSDESSKRFGKEFNKNQKRITWVELCSSVSAISMEVLLQE